MPEAPLDRITIDRLHVRCIVGIFPGEREKKQDVFITVTLHADLAKACATDDIAQTVDYKGLKKSIFAMAEASSFYLIEALADAVAARCLEDERVRRADVTVAKPGALRFAENVSVTITRENRGRGVQG